MFALFLPDIPILHISGTQETNYTLKSGTKERRKKTDVALISCRLNCGPKKQSINALAGLIPEVLRLLSRIRLDSKSSRDNRKKKWKKE